ncbi:MAG: cupin domain-containing protein [Gammaproteobacteria bacterium]|nr:cupin domain-containing protein [Gammaproteobacteria bacterium]MDH5730162.1 cupin domain-containing protein [Gammaproteobacteria bacterium]
MRKECFSHYRDVKASISSDGSLIRELLHPHRHAVKKQSLAEAVIEPGKKTLLHQHYKSEEVYIITVGQGEMTLADERFPVMAGDTVCIPPRTPHSIRNIGSRDLKLLCVSVPAFDPGDIEILEA